MLGIKKEVIDLLDDKLMRYIIDDTRTCISAFERQVVKKNYDVFSEFDKFLEKIQNVIELSSRYVDGSVKTIPCDVAWILLDLNDLKTTIKGCDYEFEGTDDCFEKSKIINKLNTFIYDTASGYLIARDYYFTEKDVEAYKKKRESMIEANKLRRKKNQEKREQYINEKKGIVEDWRKDHLNINFDHSVLSEEETRVLSAALETELKSVSLSWVQRAFGMGYFRAVTIVEHLEECGAISTLEEAKKLGLDKSEQIVLITF